MATRKTTAKTSARKAPAKRTTAKKTAPVGMLLPVSHEERWQMIAEAAYHRSRERDFKGGDDVADWLAAEAEVDARLRAEGLDGGWCAK